MADDFAPDDCRGIHTLEHDKFALNSDGKVVIRVEDEAGINGALAGVKWDAYTLDDTGATTDIYRFYEGGVSGTLLATVTLTYATNDKTQQPIQGVVTKP